MYIQVIAPVGVVTGVHIVLPFGTRGVPLLTERAQIASASAESPVISHALYGTVIGVCEHITWFVYHTSNHLRVRTNALISFLLSMCVQRSVRCTNSLPCLRSNTVTYIPSSTNNASNISNGLCNSNSRLFQRISFICLVRATSHTKSPCWK